jgi:hypothetical protein
VSVDNIQHLKSLEGAQAAVSTFSQSASFSSNCRLMGPIEPADGLSVPQFISNAFNDEFKMADIYSESGVQIKGEITKIEFSSISGLTNGYWDIGLNLVSSNGESLSVNNKYSFKSGFDAITACNATADALSPAVQDLIEATITHSDFDDLIQGS